MDIRAVIFDVGGVIQESPLDFLREYELRNDLPEGFIAGIVGNYAARPDGAWQRLERGELLLDEFCRIFDSEIANLGYSVSTAAMMLEMADVRRDPSPDDRGGTADPHPRNEDGRAHQQLAHGREGR